MTDLHSARNSETRASAQEALRLLNHVLDQPSTHDAGIQGDGDTPANNGIAVTVEKSSEIIHLPREVAEVLRDVLANASAGRSVGILPLHAELTTQQAADMLNVSRPHIIKLIDSGQLPGHKVGTHRRVYAADVKEYSHRREIESRSAADELTALTEELGLYE